MGLFAIVVALELWPMATFVRWRSERRRSIAPDVSQARAFFVLNHVQLALVVLMVFVASFMARGFGIR